MNKNILRSSIFLFISVQKSNASYRSWVLKLKNFSGYRVTVIYQVSEPKSIGEMESEDEG